MEAWLLDADYNNISVIDTFSSFIWTDRYLGYGDFEIYLPMPQPVPFVNGLYLANKESDHFMIIESMQVDTDIEDGVHLTVSGRSLESILERRIVWGQRTIMGNLQNGIEALLNENIINPTLPARKIENFTFIPSTDPYITALEIEIQFVGDNLYDVIFSLCDANNLGFRVLPVDGGGFSFELYRGTDRSYGQETIPPVVFSPSYENLLTSNYLNSKLLMKNAALVAGEGEGADQVFVEAILPEITEDGLERREVFVDVRSVSSSTESGDLTPQQYQEVLRTVGIQELSETFIFESFEGEIDATRQFVYGRDFFIGDIVQVENEFGMQSRSRMTELIHSHDLEGEKFVPTFSAVGDDY